MKSKIAKPSFIDNILNQSRDTLTLQLTALMMVLYPMDKPWMVLQVTGVLMLFHKPFLTNRWLWVVMTAETWRVVITKWWIINNHEFLIGYWCLVCLIAVCSKERDKVLSHNACMLVGLSFGFAIIWKLAANEYLNGEFIHFFLLRDIRFSWLAAMISDINLDQLYDNREFLHALKILPGPGLGVNFHGNQTLRIMAILFSFWVLWIETTLATSFLFSWPKALIRYRSALLLLFICTTYVIVPLHRFALVLNIFGFAQCPKELKLLRILHLVVAILIPLFLPVI